MFLSSLIDLGVPTSLIEDAISSLNIEGVSQLRINAFKEERHGIYGTRIEISCEDSKKSRSFSSIREIIQKSNLSSRIKEKAVEVFEIIAKAEAKIHNSKVEDVHFHEIGGVDSLVDIIGVLIGIDHLGIDRIISSPIPLGKGIIDSSHGKIPIPAPATLEILKDVPIYGTETSSELTTPTGAALIKALSKGFGPIPPLSIKRIGYGIGKRRLKERPNLVRIILGEPSHKYETDTVAFLEANLDDYNPEHLGYVMELLLKKGALDVGYIPVYMKKNRPGILINVICMPEDMDSLMDTIFKETTTSGIRYSFVLRKRLRRETVEIETEWGKIRAKKYYLPDGSSYIKPEYKDCLNIAEKYGIPLRKIYSHILRKGR